MTTYSLDGQTFDTHEELLSHLDANPRPPELNPEQLAAVTELGLTLIDQAGSLSAAVASIAGGNTAKAPLQILDTAVQAGAATVDT